MRIRELQRPQLACLTQIDYDRGMAFIATSEREPGRFETRRGAGDRGSGQRQWFDLTSSGTVVTLTYVRMA